MPNDVAPSPIVDARVQTVIRRLQAGRQRPSEGGPFANPSGSSDPFDYAEYGFSIIPEQGDLIYLLCRGLRATRVVEFATSIGMSTLYFAAAMRDNGGGIVIGSELVPAKVDAAKRNLADAGLVDYADIREGDARQTLRDLGGPVDFALIDGWPLNEGPSLARQVIEIVAPQLRIGGYVLNDNGEPDFLEFIRDPANGFLSVTLPLKGSTELSVKVSERPLAETMLPMPIDEERTKARPLLETERLLLRRPDAGDIGAIVTIAGEWEVARRLARVPHPYGEHDARFFLDAIVPNEWVWAITWRASGELIGMVGLTPGVDHDAAELGYYVDSTHWGIGIATEAAKRVVEYGIHALGLRRLTSGYFQDNPASGRVLSKLGFVEAGRAERPCLSTGSTEPSVEMRLEASPPGSAEQP